MFWGELPDMNQSTGEGFCWHTVVFMDLGAVSEEGMARGTAQHPQEYKIMRKHLAFCKGSKSGLFSSPAS